MKHIEAHVVTNPHDAQALYEAGMPDPNGVERCANCGREFSFWSAEFQRYVLVLDETDDHFYLCLDCAKPLTAPGS